MEGGSGLEGGPTCLDDIYQGNSSHSESSDAQVVEVLVGILTQGNKLLDEQNWAAALTRYSECINRANDFLRNKTTKIDVWDGISIEFKRIVMLAYSNRAEAELRLQAYEDASRDAYTALQFAPKHVTTIVRKMKAAFGLGIIEHSSQLFNVMSKDLNASLTAAYEQSLASNDLSKEDLCKGDETSCADFMGPVEIRRVRYGCGRRGLFATRGVKAGKVLLISNSLAIGRGNDRLVTKVADAVMTSKRLMAQLYSLAYPGKQGMEIPSMELFRPGSEWAPPGPEKLKVELGGIYEIVTMNAFGNDNDSPVNLEMGMEKSDHARGETSWGLWILPSFANHSCAPTCVQNFVGDSIVIRASRDLKAGEEITISYFMIKNLFGSVDTRQATAKKYFFTCQCERCVFEETLDPLLSKISKALPDLVKAERAENFEENGAARKLAALADEVEAVISSHINVQFARQARGWIRASFIKPYHSKSNLQVSKMKEMNQDDIEAALALSTWVDIMEAMNSVERRSADFPALDSHSVLLYRWTPDS